MFSTINGWSKEAMKKQIRAKNNGSKSGNNLTCLYRDADGNACAVGCFIPDDDMPWGQNEASVDEIFTDFEFIFPLELPGLKAMQTVHDILYKVPPGKDMRDVLCDWIDQNVVDGDSVCPLVKG